MGNDKVLIEKEQLQRISPRLQVVCNSDDHVNAVRAQLSAAVKSEPIAARQAQVDEAVTLLKEAISRPSQARHELGKPPSGPRSDRVQVACFVQLRSPDTTPPARIAHEQRRGELMTALLTPMELVELTNQRDSGVAYIEMGEPLSVPHAAVTPRIDGPPAARTQLPPVEPSQPPRVLVGIIDVGGFDFAHPDFLDAGKTRFLRIWDQGAKPSKLLGSHPAKYDYGVELQQARMQQAIDWSADPAHHIAATDLIKQSQQQPGSHATHVASIAAGNSGVCPGAGLIGVSIALSPEETTRELSLYDSTRLAHAVDYVFSLSEELYPGKDIPTVINISLGTNGHAHDGTSAICRWIDSALALPGRCVCVAAGNAGQEAPRFAGDLGHLTGRIHASGSVPARGLETDLEWQVVGNGIADVSENELEIWHEPGDEFEIRLRSPSGIWIGPVGPNAFVQNQRLPSETFVSIFNERYHPSNGANRISIFLSPRMRDEIVGIEAGTWVVRIRGLEIRDGRFDAWIERDDPRPLGRIGEVEAWRFPSYFTSRSNVDRSSVSSLACTMRAISVGNCDDLAERIHVSSSQGPTRDGRFKPEIAAPGTDIVAARGFSSTSNAWISMTGTSMASPFVTGVAARMLAVEKRLTAGQIAGIMRKTAQPLPSSDYKWSSAAGYGRIDARRCVEEAPKPFQPREITTDNPVEPNLEVTG
jgi:subtilisin family serine protease